MPVAELDAFELDDFQACHRTGSLRSLRHAEQQSRIRNSGHHATSKRYEGAKQESSMTSGRRLLVRICSTLIGRSNGSPATQTSGLTVKCHKAIVNTNAKGRKKHD